MQGVAVFLEDISLPLLTPSSTSSLPPLVEQGCSEGGESGEGGGEEKSSSVSPPAIESNDISNIGQLMGEVIKTVRDSIRQGFLDWSPRLLLAMYDCEIQASSESLPSQNPILTFLSLSHPSPNFPRYFLALFFFLS